MKKDKKTKENANVNNSYGAYELKSVYKRYMTRGLIFAIALHVFVVTGVMVSMYLNAEKIEEKDKPQQFIVTLDDLPPVAETEIPKDEVKQEVQKIVPLKDLASLIPKPVKRVEVTEDVKIRTQSELDRIHQQTSSTGDEHANNDVTGNIKINERTIEERIEKEPVKQENTDKIFTAFEVSVQPNAVNLAEVQAMMTYPEIAITSQTEGRVTAKVLVGKSGRVEKVISLSGPEVFYSEVKSNLKSLQFTPALQNGTPVKCYVSVPFNFKLKSKF